MTVHPCHRRTEHTWQSVRQGRGLDWNRQPRQEKIYPDSFPSRPLRDVPALDPLLPLACGPSARKIYPSGEQVLRVVPSAGALYPCELYFQARSVDGVADGIYHVEPLRGRIRLLHRLRTGQGLEGYLDDPVPIRGLVFLVSAVYYRSSWKYGPRAVRYCLLDGGHLLGALEAAAEVTGRSLSVLTRFARERLARDFGFRNREYPLALAVMGTRQPGRVEPPEMALPFIDGSGTFQAEPSIEECFAAIGQGEGGDAGQSGFRYGVDPERLGEAILRRRSIRAFQGVPMAGSSLDEMLRCARAPLPMDRVAPVDLFWAVHRVRDQVPGLYRGSQIVREGDFAGLCQYLCLEQPLGGESGVTFFLSAAADDYLALMLGAGWLGHRLCLAATLSGLGSSGIGALYDRETLAFLGEDEAMVLYALAAGL